MRPIVEICCGSYYDAKQAALGGAERIELNSALMLGGLTPTTVTLRMVKRAVSYTHLDARRNQVYTGLYRFEKDFQIVMESCAMDIHDLIQRLNEMGERVIFLGDGMPVCRKFLEEEMTVSWDFAPAQCNRQRAALSLIHIYTPMSRFRNIRKRAFCLSGRMTESNKQSEAGCGRYL